MQGNIFGVAIWPATILLCLFSNAALAQQKPAVSGLNGKFEFSAGALSLPTPAFMGRAAGALTVPLGDGFGLQADVSASTAPGFTASAALHLFTRDPDSYLLGASFGLVRSPGATILAAGPEAELYRDRVTVEAWGGVAMVRPAAPAPDRVGLFALGTVAYYPTDNWRVSLGVSSLDGYAAVQLGSEYLLDSFDLPVAVTGEARLGQDGAIRALVGLKTYFGPDPHKSLLARHREDDPADLGSALSAAAGRSTLLGEPPKGEDKAASDDKGSGGPAPGGSPPATVGDTTPPPPAGPGDPGDPPGDSTPPPDTTPPPPNDDDGGSGGAGDTGAGGDPDASGLEAWCGTQSMAQWAPASDGNPGYCFNFMTTEVLTP